MSLTRSLAPVVAQTLIHPIQLIRRVFREATSKVSCEGVEVVAFPLFAVLDGKNRADYSQRVEPSAAGGEKMGRALYAAVARGGVPELIEEKQMAD